MEIKESDVEILDKFLDNLCLNKNVDVDFLCSSGIIQYDLRNPSKGNKEAKDLLDRYNLYISAYCGEVKRIGFGSYYYIKDDRTSNFKIDGGFKELYKNQIEEKRKYKEEESLSLKKLKLDISSLESQRWKWNLSFAVSVISILVALLALVLKTSK